MVHIDKEIIELISGLTPEGKKILLATLRGMVMAAEQNEDKPNE